jgi:hypothetical protein
MVKKSPNFWGFFVGARRACKLPQGGSAKLPSAAIPVAALLLQRGLINIFR